MAEQQQIGITPQQEQQMESQLAAGTNAKLAQDGEEINEDITATLAQENAQATAAGSTDTTTESPLTNNVELSSSVPLQPIMEPIQTPSLAHIGQEIASPGFAPKRGRRRSGRSNKQCLLTHQGSFTQL